MNTVVTPHIQEMLQAAHYRPAVTILLPFQPRIQSKSELQNLIKRVTNKVETQLLVKYPDAMGMMVRQKLMTITRNLNYNTHHNSVAIFLSPVSEKILYLDMEVEERVFVDQSFEIRELVYNKKQCRKYLLLQLSGHESRLYVGNDANLVRIVSNSSINAHDYLKHTAQKWPGYSDMQERREIIRNKFLQHVDHSLDIILKAYPLPIFILGPDKVLDHFKELTSHNEFIVEYVAGEYAEAAPAVLHERMHPFIKDWRKVQDRNLLNQIEAAAAKRKLVVGMQDVWREAMSRKVRLLVIDENYHYNPQDGNIDEVIFKAIDPYNKFSYKNDPIDDVIERVLGNGGDVAFVEDGLLKDYQHVALVKF